MMHATTHFYTTVLVPIGLGLCPSRQPEVKPFDSRKRFSYSLLMLQRAAEAGKLTAQQADAIASGTDSLPRLLNATDVNSLFASPVEVVAFSDEEGIR